MTATKLSFLLAGCVFLLGCVQDQEPAKSNPPVASVGDTDDNVQPKNAQDLETTKPAGNENEPEWRGLPVSLFDGKTLDGWETIEFGGEGACEVTEGVIRFEAGVTMTGICTTRDDLPKTNFEVSLEARKIEGTDFICGLTFPVAESHCTLIAGGWGGATVGLSCIDDLDASSNETAHYMKFDENRWYKLRVRVQPNRITTWIDDKQVINEDITNKKISLRGDTDLCKPLGICSFMTSTEYRNIQLREFKPLETDHNSDSESSPDKAHDQE